MAVKTERERETITQIATWYPGDLLEGKSDKWESQRGNCTSKAGKHYLIQTSEVAWTSFTHGSSIHHRIPWPALQWEPEGFRERSGWPWQNWNRVVNKKLRKMGISWDEVEEAAEDRSWRNRVAQCVFDAGWTRNQDHYWLNCWDYSQMPENEKRLVGKLR